MTAKEQLVEMLRKAGYDMLTACEHADEFLKKVGDRPDPKMTYHVVGAHGRFLNTFRLQIKEGTR